MILTILPMAKSQKQLPETPPSWWHDLSDTEKYQYFKAAHDKAIEMVAFAKIKVEENKIEDKEKLLLMLEENKKFLENYKPFYPRWGFSLGINFLASYNKEAAIIKEMLQFDLIINTDFYIFFFKGRFFINPKINIKIYENIGGGLGVSIGFLM
jgi:hypothetical protein